jgi:hypothetical protein
MEVGLDFRKDRKLTPWAEKLVNYFASVCETPVGPAQEERPPEKERAGSKGGISPASIVERPDAGVQREG